MRNSKGKKGGDALLSALRSCWPVARGSLSSVRMGCAKKGCTACMAGTGHPAWMFANRALAQALDIYASTGKKSAVRDFLLPKSRAVGLCAASGAAVAEPLCQPSEFLHPAVQ